MRSVRLRLHFFHRDPDWQMSENGIFELHKCRCGARRTVWAARRVWGPVPWSWPEPRDRHGRWTTDSGWVRPEAGSIEVRRELHGWFGTPWWSYICYDEDGNLIEEMRKPFPAGETCLYCHELFDEAAGDSGQAMPYIHADGTAELRHVHKECQMRNVVGPVAHLKGRCSCFGGNDHDEPGRTLRQEALAVWAWVQEHGSESL